MINDNNRHQAALDVYSALGRYLNNRNDNDAKFEMLGEDPDMMAYSFKISGEDFPMLIKISVRENNNILHLYSLIPVEPDSSKLASLAVAVCHASSGLVDGCFDLDRENNQIGFKMIVSYDNDRIDGGIFHYMVQTATRIIDHYNDVFYLINTGKLSVAELLAPQEN